MCMAGRLRPEDPVDFTSNFLMHFEALNDSLPEPGKLNLPEKHTTKAQPAAVPAPVPEAEAAPEVTPAPEEA
jgi:hypothetical protein